MLYWAWPALGTMLASIILGRHVSKIIHKFVQCLNLALWSQDRKTVIKYHPDKQDVSSEPLPPDSDQDGVFTCIKIGM